jgi:putative toxin-antitoxin system antitoxin component (TIGR02293 family)
MQNTGPNEKHYRAVHEDGTSLTIGAGGHRRDAIIQARWANIGLLFVASAVAAVAAETVFVGTRRGEGFGLLVSIPCVVLSIVSIGLAFRSARIATRLERTLKPEVPDNEQVRAHETESAVLMRALEVFGDSERALQWMWESNPALKNESPIRAVQTETGRHEVLNILGRIQHGVIS